MSKFSCEQLTRISFAQKYHCQTPIPLRKKRHLWEYLRGIEPEARMQTFSLSSAMCFVAGILVGPSAIAADWKALTGTYSITAENYLDPAPNENPSSHIRLQLTGQAARDLFRAMNVRESKDTCTSAMSKQIGEMRCLRFSTPSRYECHFSVNLPRQTVELGVAC
jgi:hypothetical protein